MSSASVFFLYPDRTKYSPFSVLPQYSVNQSDHEGQDLFSSPIFPSTYARLGGQSAAVASTPMKIHPDAVPNAENATLRAEKLIQYSLNMNSETGRHKALVFDSVLGYNPGNQAELRKQLLDGVALVPGVRNLQDAHGQRYTALIPVSGPKGSATVTTGWIIRPGTSNPDLTTAFIDTRRNKNV